MPRLNQSSLPSTPVRQTFKQPISRKYHDTIERLDQGHLYPLRERRDKHVPGGARTSALLHRRRLLYLKSYPDSLSAGYSEPLLGRHLLTTFGPLQYCRQTFKRTISWKYHAAVHLKLSHICVGFPRCLGWTRALSPPHQLDRHSNGPSLSRYYVQLITYGNKLFHDH